MNIILDAHQDLAYNMAALGRDYRRSAYQTRQLEKGMPFMAWTDDALLGWPEYMQARVALVFSTLFAAPARSVKPEQRDSQIYDTLEQAHTIYKQQLLRSIPPNPHPIGPQATPGKMASHPRN